MKDYKSGGKKKFSTIEKVVDNIYGSMRSGFSHSLNYDHLWKDNYKLHIEKAENRESIVALPELSIDRFLCISWVALLRSFGYPNLL